MKLIENPITKHLPLNKPVVSLSVQSKLVNLNEYVLKFKNQDEVIFVVGGFAHGHLDINYATEEISISQYPLSAAAVAARVTAAFE